MQVAQSAAIPLAYVLQSGFDTLRIKEAGWTSNRLTERQLQIDHVFAGRRGARAGEAIELIVGLAGENGSLVTRKVVYAGRSV